MLLLAAAVATASPATGQERQDMRMAERRESFISGGQRIAVELFGPGGTEGRLPAVIMLHGADGLSSNTRYRTGAKAIAGAGFRVFLVHYLDRTQERRAAFATVFQHFVRWTDTVRDAVAFVASHPDVDSSRIGLVGISLGAALGLAIAGTERRIKALVDYFGPLPQGAVMAHARLPPTLILHGGADGVVPVANAYAIEALLKEQGVAYDIKVYAGQGHGFHGAAQDDATARVLEFLRRHLRSGS
jgi:carboxymethylenebutenolidase